MPGVRKKRPEQLIFQRDGRGQGLVVSGGRPKPPNLPRGWVKTPFARKAWSLFWSDANSVNLAVVTEADYERLLHWIWCVDQREQVKQAISQDGRMVRGARGAMVRHPLAQDLSALNKEIRDIAAAYGMTPMSRFRLQIEASDAERKRRRLLGWKPSGESSGDSGARDATPPAGYIPDEEPVDYGNDFDD